MDVDGVDAEKPMRKSEAGGGRGSRRIYVSCKGYVRPLVGPARVVAEG